jgi:hypothetical protein
MSSDGAARAELAGIVAVAPAAGALAVLKGDPQPVTIDGTRISAAAA